MTRAVIKNKQTNKADDVSVRFTNADNFLHCEKRLLNSERCIRNYENWNSHCCFVYLYTVIFDLPALSLIHTHLNQSFTQILITKKNWLTIRCNVRRVVTQWTCPMRSKRRLQRRWWHPSRALQLSQTGSYLLVIHAEAVNQNENSFISENIF